MEAAVVSASQGAVRILLGKLGNVLATKYALLSGVRGEIQEVKDELESMTSCLRDLADGDDHSMQTRTWMKQVREVAYDVEDCLDSFCHHLGEHSRDSRGLLKYLHRMINLLRTLRVRHKLAADIQSLKSRAQKVSDRRLRYKLDQAAGSSKELDSLNYLDSLDRWLPAIHDGGSGLVGMDDKIDKVVELLKEQPDGAGLRVLSIVGFGGLGKTTLATAAYNSPDLSKIECRAFVPVSQTYNVGSLLESVIKQTEPPPKPGSTADTGRNAEPVKVIKTKDISELAALCRDTLKDRRYLIILDDVWQPAAWENLKIAFPDNGKQSRIIITTRSQQVAKNCCTTSIDHVYKMEPLGPEDSKRLFLKTVFDSDNLPPEHSVLKDVYPAVLKRCDGLPLVIVNIGRMLARRQNMTPAEWQKVCDRLGSELETNPSLERVRRKLELSYDELPYSLKASFLYLCAFPEDYEIRRAALIRRWAAEGLITGMYGLSLEQIAQSYFDEFISRSIVSCGQIGSTGEIMSCKVHDIMLEVITSKSIQDNFISFLGNNQYNTEGHDKIRRLSIHPGGNTENRAFSSKNMTHARSLTILGSIEKPLPITFSELTLLRVLDLEGCRWLSNQDLKGICKLYLLRYLSLRSADISKLPYAVGNLKELETLDVRETAVTKFPATITRLQNLKHLLTGCYIYHTRSRSIKHHGPEGVRIPPGLERMHALQRISHVDISKSFRAMRELGQLSQLRKLCALNKDADDSKWEPFVESLNKLSNSLRCLMIQQFGNTGKPLDFLGGLQSPPLFLQGLHLRGGLSQLPVWFSSLSNLATVSFRETRLGLELIEILGKLPNLLSFKIYAGGYVGGRLCFEQDQFPRLKQLVLDYPQVDELSFRGGATNLERITLGMSLMPERGVTGFETLLKLREIEFFGPTNDSIVEKVVSMVKNHQNPPRVVGTE